MQTPVSTTRVWDLPLRLFHWLLVICIVGSFVTANVGGFWMDYHFVFGYTILALLLFRLIWGVVGPTTARFSTFVRGPSAVLAYLQQKPRTLVHGHNPLGAISVIAMLLALLVQVGTGLFATDGILSEGPLAIYVSSATSDTLTGIHQINKIIILVLVVLHLVAIAWYALVRRQPLVRAMITGNVKTNLLPQNVQPTKDYASTRVLALVVAAIAAGLTWWIVA